MIGPELQFLHGKSYVDYSFCVEKRYDQYHALQFMSSGTVCVSYGSETQQLEGAWLWPCDPGPVMRFEPGSSGSWNHRYVALRGPQINAWQGIGIWPSQPQRVRSEYFASRFDQRLSLFQGNTTWTHQRAATYLEGMLLELADERSGEPQRRQAWLDDCIRKMSVNSYINCNYESIAESWGMSLSTLRRRFRQEMGESIHRFALHQRMLLAQRLLRESIEPLKQIADQLGYSDVYFFARQFKQWNGMTPGRYRQSGQQS
jgi:AraC-like DNA-binding protein